MQFLFFISSRQSATVSDYDSPRYESIFPKIIARTANGILEISEGFCQNFKCKLRIDYMLKFSFPKK